MQDLENMNFSMRNDDVTINKFEKGDTTHGKRTIQDTIDDDEAI